MVGAPLLALPALHAGCGLYRQRAVAVPGPLLQAVAAEVAVEQEHIRDADACRTGGAVVAAAAEVGAQLLPDRLQLLPLSIAQRGAVLSGGDILGHLVRAVRAGDDHRDIGVGAHIPQRQTGVLDRAAGQRLHADKADALLTGLGHQLLPLVLHNVVGEHDGLHPVQRQSPPEDLQGVGGNAQVADLPGAFCLLQRLQRAARAADLLQLLRRGVVDLVQVYVVRAQIVLAGLDVRRHGRPVPGHGLGGQDERLPVALNGLPDQLLADRVAPGGINVVDAAGPDRLQQRGSLMGVHALDGNAAEAQPGYLQPGPP